MVSSQGCFLGWTKPSKSSVLRKLHLGSVGWKKGGGALLCFCLTEVHDLLSWRFSAGFSLDLIQRKVLRFFFCFI